MHEKVALKENVSLIINIKSAHYTLYFHHISRDLNKMLLKSLNKNTRMLHVSNQSTHYYAGPRPSLNECE